MFSLITATGQKHPYLFIRKGKRKPLCHAAIFLLHKNESSHYTFKQWLEAVYDKRYSTWNIQLAFIIEYENIYEEDNRYVAVFYKKENGKTEPILQNAALPKLSI